MSNYEGVRCSACGGLYEIGAAALWERLGLAGSDARWPFEHHFHGQPGQPLDGRHRESRDIEAAETLSRFGVRSGEDDPDFGSLGA